MCFTYWNPISNILRTPSQNRKYKSLGVQFPDGHCATGNLKPLSLMNMNCKTWVASSGLLSWPGRNRTLPVRIVYRYTMSRLLTFTAWLISKHWGDGRILEIMQSVDYILGLHDCLKFSHPSVCLDEAMYTGKKCSVD